MKVSVDLNPNFSCSMSLAQLQLMSLPTVISVISPDCLYPSLRGVLKDNEHENISEAVLHQSCTNVELNRLGKKEL